MTTWKNVREALRAQCASGLGWSPLLVNWETEPAQVDQCWARLTIVSSLDEGERREDIITGPPIEVYTLQDVRAQIQIQIEYIDDAERAWDLAADLRTHLCHKSTKDALAALGVALVQEPGPARSAGYDSDGNAVSVALFELPIRFTSRTLDKRAKPKAATRITYTGTAAGVAVSGTVDKP